jgi:hypothetical protein
MRPMQLIGCVFLLTAISGFSIPASATVSVDGSSLLSGGSGSIVTSAGTWTFSTTTGAGGNLILLNGSSSAADGGSGTELVAGNGGNMYVENNVGNWYQWNSGTWTRLSGTPFPISADGSLMVPNGPLDIVTNAGIWAFSTTTGAGGYLITLDGSNSAADAGSGVKLVVNNSGILETVNNVGNWYQWSGSAWVKIATPINAICASAVVVGIQWPAVTSATSYTVSRSGNTLGSTALLTYTDKTVAASTSYVYSVEAFDGSTALSTQTLDVRTPVATTTGDPAYCPSTVIASITPNWSAGVYQANGSDLWSQTLASDGNEYGYWGDGQGFGGTETGTNGKVAWGIGAISSSTGGTLTGAVNVYGGISAEHAANISGKATSILEIGPSTNMNFYALGGTKGSGSQNFGGSGITDQDIVYSTGNAWSWIDNDTNWGFCVNGGTPGIFCPTIFLQNGPGYSGNTDGYVYLYGGTENTFFGNGTPGTSNTYLWRVPTSQSSILSATAYQAVTGWNANGTPVWSSGSISTLSTNMVPVFTDKQSSAAAMGLSEVTYNPGIGRYIASAENDVNQVAFYDAPNPWGPWTSIGYFNSNPSSNAGGWGNLGAGISLSSWGNGQGDGLGINFVDKWMSSNGQTMWVVFSSDKTASTSASLTALQGQNMDGFIAVPLTLTPAP